MNYFPGLYQYIDIALIEYTFSAKIILFFLLCFSKSLYQEIVKKNGGANGGKTNNKQNLILQ